MMRIFFCTIVLGVALWWGGADMVPAVEANAAREIFTMERLVNPTPVEVRGMAGPGDVRGFALSLIRIAKNIISVLAVLALVIVGVRMVTSVEGDEQVATQRKILLGIILGLVVINIAEPFVFTFFQQQGTITGGSEAFYSQIAPLRFQRDIVEPLIGFAMTFIAGIAVFMIVVAGMRIITAAGDENVQKQQQFVIVQAVLGLFVILIARPIVQTVYGYRDQIRANQALPEPDIAFGLQVLVQVMNYILSFFFIGAVAMLIYAGFLMVAHFGQDEMVDRAKKIIRSTVVAIIIAISAYTLVAWVVTLTP